MWHAKYFIIWYTNYKVPSKVRTFVENTSMLDRKEKLLIYQ